MLLLQLRISQLVTDDSLQLTHLLSVSMDNISCFFEAFAVISSPENEVHQKPRLEKPFDAYTFHFLNGFNIRVFTTAIQQMCIRNT